MRINYFARSGDISCYRGYIFLFNENSLKTQVYFRLGMKIYFFKKEKKRPLKAIKKSRNRRRQCQYLCINKLLFFIYMLYLPMQVGTSSSTYLKFMFILYTRYYYPYILVMDMFFYYSKKVRFKKVKKSKIAPAHSISLKF